MKASFTHRIDTTRQKARLVLRIEQLWRALRLWLVVPILWVGSSLFHFPQSLPDSLHWLIEVPLFGGVLWGIIHALKRLPPLTSQQIDTRIERDSRTSFQPLMVLSDVPARPITTDAVSSADDGIQFVWAQHQSRILERAQNLRVHAPRLFPKPRDKVIALLVILGMGGAFYISNPYTLTRIRAGLLPGTDDDSVALPQFQAWIDNPSYAPAPPLFLNANPPPSSTPLAQGAIFHLIVTGSATAPSLSGVHSLHYRQLSEKSWQVEGQLTESATITIRVRGRTLASWPLNVTPDLPPVVQWTGKPSTQPDDWHTTFPWKAQQNHGIASLEIELSLPPHPHQNRRHRVAHIPIPLTGHPRDAHAQTTLDLSDDPFAGMIVNARLHARGVSGLESTSTSVHFRLGARPFTDPLARALITLRQQLALGDENLTEAKRDLTLLGELPLPRDILTPLWMIITQLHSTTALDTLQEKLWFLALYAEDRQQNGLVMAASMAELRAAQQDVALQLEHMAAAHPPTTAQQTELHQRLDRLQKALNTRMTLMVQKANQSGIVMPLPNGKGAPWNKLSQTIQRDALHNQTDQALASLRQLVDMAERMRQATMGDMQSLAQQMKAQAEIRAQKRALRDLIKQETQLLNRTQARLTAAQKNGNLEHEDISHMSTADLLRQLGMNPPANTQDSTSSQELDHTILWQQSPERRHDHAIQRALQTLDRILLRRSQEQIHQNFKGLKKADHDMSTALHDLAQQRDDHAVISEQKVLDDLSQARKEMQQSQKSSQKGHLGFIPPPSQGEQSQSPQNGAGQKQNDLGSDLTDPDQDEDSDDQNENHDDDSSPKQQDPLGRKLDDGPTSDAHIPSQDNNQRRAIERELQRRASDRTRPQSELDYLNRLLAPLHDNQ
ncbi:DUF4175 family protein [Saccharibacter sp. 17.LH.SD]|uniref:DUF4175 family protein n=1 Tax=Saccharibacter sp. 17.LH.SD TaxID=2689393 RepID=UPI0013722D31|nr:DUF4175 family protein [Saccharibacter sp. 17.LH.SD]MXV44194.1 DUF4175 family protein [Saccharibacter sp. 17.LH.SD]